MISKNKPWSMPTKKKSQTSKNSMGQELPNFNMNMLKRLKNLILFKLIYNYRSINFKLRKTNKMFRLKD